MAEAKPSYNEELRCVRREQLRVHQDSNRLQAFDSNRFVDSEIVGEKDVVGLCSRIKRRKHADAEDLEKLSTAFVQSEVNISSFMKVTGAINVIVKEFTGNNRGRQLLAAQCLCNLSLGDEHCCSKIATFAGSYLMIFIMKPDDTRLAKFCLWTTQNIIASGSKPLNILMSQELLKNCLHILNHSVDLHDDALQLLDLIIDGKWNDLLENERQDTQLSVWKSFEKRFREPLALQVLCKATAGDSTVDYSIQHVRLLASNLKEETHDEIVIHLSIKILSNLFRCDQRTLDQFLEILLSQDTKLSAIINSAAENPKLFNVIKDLLRFLSHLLASPSSLATQYFAFDPIDNLRIPKLLEF